MQHIDQLLREHDLYHKKSAIISSFKNSIRMEKVEVDEVDIPIGSSKLGGLPDLPDGMEFPKYKKGFLWFMGQFNLKEAKPHDKDNLLPESGILYCFMMLMSNLGALKRMKGVLEFYTSMVISGN